MKNYLDHEALQGLVLEESYVLSITVRPAVVRFRVDFALASSHPEYDPDHEGPYSSRTGLLTFGGVTELTWRNQGAPPAVDASGEPDYGTIDALEWADGRFRLEGDWGVMDVAAADVSVELEEGPLLG